MILSALLPTRKPSAGWRSFQLLHFLSIALTLVIWRSGKIIHRLGDGMLIANWHFLAGGKPAAFYTNTVHGDDAPHYELWDLQTGRKIAKWDGPLSEKAPLWAKELSD